MLYPFRPMLIVLSLVLIAGCNSNPSIPNSSLAPTDTWSRSGIPIKLEKALTSVGVTSSIDSQNGPDGISLGLVLTDEHYSQLFDDGWGHVMMFVGVDAFFDVKCDSNGRPCLKEDRVKRKFKLVAEQLSRLTIKYPDKAFVIAPKITAFIEGYDCRCEPSSFFLNAYENNPEMREAFKMFWSIVATELADLPSDQVVFNLMNEPEYHKQRNGKEKWLNEASDLVSVIRSISPDRIVVLEGIQKATYIWRNGSKKENRGIYNILEPINFDKVIYAFHYYSPGEFVAQGSPWEDKYKPKRIIRLTDSMKRAVRSDLSSLSDFSSRYGVPVMLNEAGVFGPFIHNGTHINGATAEDRAEYAEIIVNETIDRGIGFTWFGLANHNTPYKRLTSSKWQSEWVPEPRLWKALRLE